MSNVLNDLILTDVSGLSIGDSLQPGSGLSGVADSGVVTAWTDPSVLATGDGIYLNSSTGTITSLGTLTADVTYSSALGNVTASMTLLVIEVTDTVTGLPATMLMPLDATGDLVHITDITITAVNTTPGLTQIDMADIESDDTVTLDTPGTIDGTDGSDTIQAGWSDGVDTAGDSGDNIEANGGDDVVYGGLGDDTISGGAGNDWLFGGAGNDVISGNDGHDSIWGDAGDDTLFGNEGNDKLIGGQGNDLLIGGEGDNLMYGDSVFGDTGGWSPTDTPEPGYGSDTLVMGNGNDTAYGGSGDDFFRVFDDFGNHVIVGGEAGETLGDKIDATQMTQSTKVTYTGDEEGTMENGTNSADFSEIERINLGIGDDEAEVISSTTGYISGGEGYDTLVLPEGDDAAEVFITNEVVNPDGTVSKDGYVVFKDGKTLTFENFEEILCFATGTLVDTLRGRVAVEDLVPGDKVLTRDHGYQPLVWTGRRDLDAAELAANPAVAPVRIAAGALGKGLPERDLIVSPRHRMLLTGARAELMFGEREVLVAAGDLLSLPGVSRVTEGAVSYVHVMCDSHEILRAEGAWSESFQPAEAVINALDAATRAELMMLFPELATEAGRAAYAAARPVLNGAEARELFAA